MRKESWIFLLFTSLTLGSCANTEHADFLIPKGYSGRVSVVFEQKQGEKPKYLNGRRIYEIPSNGILLTQFEFEPSIIDYRYFLVGRDRKQTLLPKYEYDHNKDGTVRYLVKDSEQVGIFDLISVAYVRPDDNPSVSIADIPGLEFFVSTFNGLDTVETMQHFGKRVDSLTHAARDL